MKTFSALGSISTGWELFKKRAGFFVGVMIVVGVIYLITSFVFGPKGFMGSFGSLIPMLVGMLISMGLTHVSLKAYTDPSKLELADLWYPQSFVSFLISTIVVAIVTIIGFILFIIPGVIAVLAFFFVKYVVIDRNVGPFEALQESVRITRGHRWELLVFLIATVLLNVAGFLCLFVGLLITAPVTMLAVAVAYRELEALASPKESELTEPVLTSATE